MDLSTLAMTPVLDEPGYGIWQAHFSPDGRWMTFNAIKDNRSIVYVAPFRKAVVPRNEWIPITDGQADDKPYFSSDGKLIIFTSDRDGFRCIWAQRLSSENRALNSPFAVYHFHQRRGALANLGKDGLEIDVGPGIIVFNRAELSGNVWLLEPAKGKADAAQTR